jgi:hypothetical protein
MRGLRLPDRLDAPSVLRGVPPRAGQGAAARSRRASAEQHRARLRRGAQEAARARRSRCRSRTRHLRAMPKADRPWDPLGSWSSRLRSDHLHRAGARVVQQGHGRPSSRQALEGVVIVPRFAIVDVECGLRERYAPCCTSAVRRGIRVASSILPFPGQCLSTGVFRCPVVHTTYPGYLGGTARGPAVANRVLAAGRESRRPRGDPAPVEKA